MADDAPGDADPLWTINLDKVQRLTGDEPEAEGENLFAVELTATGTNMSADIEVLVSDIADESQIIVAALDALQDGLERWGQVLGRRPGAERIEPSED